MIIALASPRVASALDEGLDRIKRFLPEASAQGAAIVCFPEAYLPLSWSPCLLFSVSLCLCG